MEKRNKQSAKGKTHDAKLVDALKSLYPSSTQITSILPVQTKLEVAGTAQAARSKGTKSPSSSQMPQKLLLQLTDPGKAPVAPKAVANPGTLEAPNFAAYTKSIPASYGKGGFNKSAKSYAADIDAFNTARANYLSYLTAQKAYTNNLTNYNTAVAQRNAQQATNTARTTQYKKDLANFFSSARSGKVGSRRRATTRKGSRTTGSGSSGRSGRIGTR